MSEIWDYRISWNFRKSRYHDTVIERAGATSSWITSLPTDSTSNGWTIISKFPSHILEFHKILKIRDATVVGTGMTTRAGTYMDHISTYRRHFQWQCWTIISKISSHILKFHKILKIRDATVVGTRTDELEVDIRRCVISDRINRALRTVFSS